MPASVVTEHAWRVAPASTPSANVAIELAPGSTATLVGSVVRGRFDAPETVITAADTRFDHTPELGGKHGDFEALGGSIGHQPVGHMQIKRRSTEHDTSTATRVQHRPGDVNIDRHSRETKDESEAAAIVAVASAHNSLRGTDYTPKHDPSTRGFDGTLESRVHPRLNVEVRNLDAALIQKLCRSGHVERHSYAQIEQTIAAAIEDKARRYGGNRMDDTILVLHLPTVLDDMTQRELAAKAFDARGFREVWITNMREAAFPLRKQ